MATYSPTLLDHFHSPRNVGRIEDPDCVGRAGSADRGPYLIFYLKLCGDHVDQVRFQAFGCGHAIAAASVVTEIIQNCSLSRCLRITPREVITSLGGMPEHKAFCAELAVSALQAAITDQHGNVSNPNSRNTPVIDIDFSDGRIDDDS